MRNVAKSYNNELLFDIEQLDLPPGVYLISDENGVGKSTLVNIIYGACEYQGKVDLGDVKEE